MKSHLSYLIPAAASAALLLAAVPASAQNLLSNPGFETGGFEGFNVFGQGFRTAGGDDARTGDFGAVNDVLTTDDTNQFRGLQQTVDAAAGETYSASVFIRTVAQNESAAFLELEFFDGPEDADGNPTGAQLARFESDQVFTDQDFTEAVIDPVVAPAGTESVRIGGIVFKNATINDDEFIIFDDFGLFVPEPTAALSFALVGGLALARRRR